MDFSYVMLSLWLGAVHGLQWQVPVQAAPQYLIWKLRSMTGQAGQLFNELHPVFDLGLPLPCNRWRGRYPSFHGQAGQDNEAQMAIVMSAYSKLITDFVKDLRWVQRLYYDDDTEISDLRSLSKELKNISNILVSPPLTAPADWVQIAHGNETNRNRKNVCILKYAAEDLWNMVLFLEQE